MRAVYRKELRTFFSGMVGYIFIGFVLLIAGIFITATNFRQGYPNFEYSLGSVSMILLFVVPILTMRIFAEERHSKTDQLLYSLPISVKEIVLGKYFAALTVFAIPCAVMCVYPVIMSFYGKVSFTSAYGAMVGFFLLGAALIAVGEFMSSLTESQLIAAVISFGAMLVIYMMSSLSSLIPSTSSASYISFAVVILILALIIYYMTKSYWTAFTAAAILELILAVLYFTGSVRFEGLFSRTLNALSFWSRLDNFVFGIFDVTAVVYYITVCAVFMVLTVQSVEKRRWS
jgi:ABC-2 type transport system permease protein